MLPHAFYKCLSDETRLRTLLLIRQNGELCVCELVEALELSQPKISRHLATLRQCGLLQDRRQGQWVYYRLHPQLPDWCLAVLAQTAEDNQSYVNPDQKRLQNMTDRPDRAALCCD
ncbi:MAG: metalloregulator ArsR/SmtB family transcription factor [Saccharospirillum sp.]|nr:metalloregulator ArsR/SmtB family transcription factor [Saccharospirillum sp.]